MKKFIVVSLLLVMLLSGCGKNSTSYTTASINNSRLDSILSENNGTEQESKVESDVVDDIIKRFNKISQGEISIGNYTVKEDENGYIVTTADAKQYRFTTDKEGKVVAILLLTGSNEEREMFSRIAMELINNNSFTPNSFKNDVQEILKKAESIDKAIEEHLKENFSDVSIPE